MADKITYYALIDDFNRDRRPNPRRVQSGVMSVARAGLTVSNAERGMGGGSRPGTFLLKAFDQHPMACSRTYPHRDPSAARER